MFMLVFLFKNEGKIIWAALLIACHSPLFFRKIVEIERFELPATILDECQIFFGGRERIPSTHRYKTRRPPPQYKRNQDGRKKIGGCEQSTLHMTPWLIVISQVHRKGGVVDTILASLAWDCQGQGCVEFFYGAVLGILLLYSLAI